MADRTCSACGRPLERDVSPRARMCRRDDCVRQRNREKVRKHRAGGKVLDFQRPAVEGPVSGGLADAVRSALTEVGQTESWEGRAALLLAERIDATERESGSAYAAMVAKLESSMELALRPRPGESFVDELRRKRQDRVRGGTG